MAKLLSELKGKRTVLYRGLADLEARITSSKDDKTELLCLQEIAYKRLERIDEFDKQIAPLSENEEETLLEAMEYDEVRVRIKVKLREYIKNIEKLEEKTNINDDYFRSKSPDLKRSRLPEIRLKTFGGDFEDWMPFYDTFVAMVHEREDLSAVEKFQYLISCLRNEAQKTIAGFKLTSANYEKALNLLITRFANKEAIINGLMKSMVCVSNVDDPWNVDGLRIMCDQLEAAVRSAESMGIHPERYEELLIPLVSSKLPLEIIFLWMTEKPENSCNAQSFLEFLQSHVRLKERSVALKKEYSKVLHSTKRSSNNGSNEKRDSEMFYTASSMHVNAVKNGNECYPPCIFCNEQHASFRCRKVKTMSVQERTKIVEQKKACKNCLKRNHDAERCRLNLKCKLCEERHNTLLCFKDKEYDNQEVSPANALHVKVSNDTLLMTLTCQLVDLNGKERSVRVLVDPGSERSFVKEEVVSHLNLKHLPSEFMSIEGFNSTKISQGEVEVIELYLVEKNKKASSVKFPAVMVNEICKPLKRIPLGSWRRELSSKNVELGDVCQEFPGQTADVDILLGADCYPKIIMERTIKTSGPVAMETVLGWVLCGPSNTVSSLSMARVMHVQIGVEERVDEILKSFWTLESMGIKSQEENLKQEVFNRKVVKETCDSIEQLGNKHYQVALPRIKEREINCNYVAAKKRLNGLMKKLNKQPELYKRYQGEIETLETMSFASRLTTNFEENEGFYLPHRGVLKEQRETTKLRVVFDGSAKDWAGVALNSCFHPGPNLNPELLRILLNFRLKKFVLVGDIEKAFLQIYLHEEDRKLCRFLWQDESGQEIVYQMNRVLFGLNCSPFLLAVVIRYHIQKYRSQFEEVVESLSHNLYVDDWVTTTNNLEQLYFFKDQGERILKEGGFNMSKWKSNVHTVTTNDLNKKLDKKLEKILGINWNSETDTISFDLKDIVDCMSSVKQITKREILRCGSRIFDPLGLLTPVTIQFKILIQKLWAAGLGWDEEVKEEFKKEWEDFVQQVKSVDLECSRSGCSDFKSAELHVFVDASEKAYAAVVFVKEGGVDARLTLLVAKARVAPLKRVTVPRLELLGAVLGARTLNYIRESSEEYKNMPAWLWSDSRVALGWIKKPATTWRLFVENRVSEIQTLTSPTNWRYVPSEMNPADVPSRGTFKKNTLQNWHDGPQWVMDKESWPEQPDIAIPQEEEKRNILCLNINTKVIEESDYSSYDRLIRVTAYVLLYLKQLKRSVRNKKNFNTDVRNGKICVLKLLDVKTAEHYWWKRVQSEKFSVEIEALKKNSGLKESPVAQLNPYLDEHGLIRIKGRLQHSTLALETKHLVIVDNKHWVVLLFIDRCHRLTAHGGLGLTLSLIREKIWIMNSRNAVKKRIRSCIVCKRYLKKTLTQVMAPLPESRVTERGF